MRSLKELVTQVSKGRATLREMERDARRAARTLVFQLVGTAFVTAAAAAALVGRRSVHRSLMMGAAGGSFALAGCLGLAHSYNPDAFRSPRYTGYMCEICPFGVSKWTGVTMLASQWGILPEQICAAGDDVNDIPMIEAAGLGVAMGNALDEVKAAADRIAPGNDEDGLVHVINWLLEQAG